MVYFSFLGPFKYGSIFFVSFLLTLFFLKEKIKIESYDFNLFSVYLSLSLISLVMNFSFKGTLYYFMFIINMIVLVFLRKYKLTVAQQLTLFWIVIILSIYPKFDDFTGGLTSIFENANTLAIILILPFFLLYNIKRYISCFIFYPLFFINVILMLMTNSRSTYIFLLVFFLLMISSKIVSLKLLKIISIIGVISSLTLYYFLMNGEVSSLITLALENTEKGLNLTGRDNLFKISVNGIIENPLGIGFGSSNVFIENVIGNNLSSHNTYLKIFLEGGILLMVAFIITTLLILYKLDSSFLVSFFVAYLIKLMFESMIPFTFSLISVIFMLPYFLGERINEKNYNIVRC